MPANTFDLHSAKSPFNEPILEAQRYLLLRLDHPINDLLEACSAEMLLRQVETPLALLECFRGDPPLL